MALDGEDLWKIEVSKLLLQMTQEVHALNPGIFINARLEIIERMAELQPAARDGEGG